MTKHLSIHDLKGEMMRDSIEGKSNGINKIRKNIHSITPYELDTYTFRSDNRILHEICSNKRIKHKTELINLILDRGANIEIENNRKQTPLISALIHNEWSLVIHLINKGAYIDRAFIWAAETGNFEKMKFMAKLGMGMKIPLDWNYALYNTAKENYREMSLYLIDVGVRYAEKNGEDFSAQPFLTWGESAYGSRVRGWIEKREIKMGRLIMNRFLKIGGGIERALDPFLKLNEEDKQLR